MAAAASSSSAASRSHAAVSISAFKFRTIDRSELEFEETDWSADEKSPDEIGNGGFGTVYKAKWTPPGANTHLVVAVKMVPMDKPVYKRRFIQELRAMSESSMHPPSLAVYGAHRGEDHCYVVMELLPYGDLEHFIHCDQPGYQAAAGHPASGFYVAMSGLDRWQLMLSMAQAVLRLHRLGFHHRDIKPSNFLMHRDPDGVWSVRVSDLGTCSTLWTSTSTSPPVIERERAPGTDQYKAPEWMALTLNTYESSMDVYSLGVTFWELLCGEEPYGRRQFDADLKQQLSNGKRLPLRERLSRVLSEPLLSHAVRLIAACWHADPAKRPTMEQVVQWLTLVPMAATEDELINEVAGEIGGSWAGAKIALRKLLDQDVALSSDAVHRVLAVHVHRNGVKNFPDDELAQRFRIPQYSGSNQFINSELAGRFYERYYDSVTDEALATSFVVVMRLDGRVCPSMNRPRRPNGVEHVVDLVQSAGSPTELAAPEAEPLLHASPEDLLQHQMEAATASADGPVTKKRKTGEN